MSITTLAGTEWYFVEHPVFTGTFEYDNIVWRDINYRYTKMRAITDNYGGYSFGGYYPTWNYWMNSYYYVSGVHRWSSLPYRTIKFISGDDLTNPDLIAWVTANAYPSVYRVSAQEVEQTAVTIRAKAGSSDSYTWTNGTGFKDAVNSIYVGNDTRQATALPIDAALGVTFFADGQEFTGTMADANGVSF